MSLSLRARILVITALVVTGTAVAMATAAGGMFSRVYANALGSRTEAVAKGLALQMERLVALGMAPEEIEGFEEQCAESVAAYPGLAWALVAQEGRVLFDSRHKGSPKSELPAPVQASLSGQANGTFTYRDPDSGERIHAAVRTVQGGAADTGARVVVGYPHYLIQQELNALYQTSAAIGLLALIAGLILLRGSLARFVSGPVLNLVQAMDAMRRDDTPSRERLSEHQETPELAVVVESFNRLLDRIDEREAQLVLAREAAEAGNRAKSEFLATISHEIRTPMNAIIGMTDLLEQTALNERQQRYAATVSKAGQDLLTIINDILDFSRIEAGHAEVSCDPFALRDTVEQTVRLFGGLAVRKGLRLELEMPANVPQVVEGDGARLAQVLNNLTGNAIKFTERGSVTLRVGVEGARLRFEVEDTGIGIPAEAQARIWEPFRQADGSHARKYGGTGLGLAICHRLVEAMGGEIGVISTPGQGSLFHFTLPLLRHTAPGSEPKQPAEAAVN